MVNSPATISVIIPAYNSEATLKATIESVLDQDPMPVDVIVINDGSTDATRDIALAFGSRITYIEQTNHGVAHARNTGADAAKGLWFCFLDSDDRLLPKGLGALADSAISGRAGVVFGSLETYNPANGKRERRITGKSAGTPPHPARVNFWRSSLTAPGAAIVSRDVHYSTGGFVNAPPVEDRDYWMKCGVLTAFEYRDVLVLEKLIRSDSASQRKREAIISGIKIQRSFLTWCSERDINTAFLDIDQHKLVHRAVDKAITWRSWGALAFVLGDAFSQGLFSIALVKQVYRSMSGVQSD